MFGKLDGTGKYVTKDKIIYEGLFSNDDFYEGSRIATQVATIRGKFKNWRSYGTVLVTYADGSTILGEWDDGKLLRGLQKNQTGRVVYEGGYEKVRFHGKGKLFLDNGDTYEGDFIEGARDGKGIYTFVDGRRYEGEFKNNKFHGIGNMMFPDGITISGKWLEGEWSEAH